MLLARCNGSHMQCRDASCMCACHGHWRKEPELTEVPKKKRTRNPVSPRRFQDRRIGPQPTEGYRDMTDDDLTATEHGTMQGYRWHVRNKVTSCAPCRQANAEYILSVRRGDRPAEKKLWQGAEAEIREKFAQGHSVHDLSRVYCADRRTINKIVGRGSMRRGTRREAATQSESKA